VGGGGEGEGARNSPQETVLLLIGKTPVSASDRGEKKKRKGYEERERGKGEGQQRVTDLIAELFLWG